MRSPTEPRAPAIDDLARFPEENPDPVLRVARGGLLLYANPAARVLLDHWRMDVGDPVPAEVDARVAAALRQGIAHELSVTVPPDDYVLRLQPVPAADYVNVYASDASLTRTDARLAAARDAALAANRDLELLVAELQRSNEELDMFTSIVSHDLRAPLRAIEQLAEWVLEDVGDSITGEPRENLVLIGARAKRAAMLMDSLHRYAKLGGHDQNLEAVALGELVDDVVQSLELPAGFAVTHAIQAKPFETTAVALRQVLYNLINNAIKHHDRDAGTITVAARDAHDHVVISVSDDGPGIDPRFHDRIFRMFATLKSRDEQEASGMGLAMVKKQVSLVGGRIAVASDGVRGTTFTLHRPYRLPPRERITVMPPRDD